MAVAVVFDFAPGMMIASNHICHLHPKAQSLGETLVGMVVGIVGKTWLVMYGSITRRPLAPNK